MNAVHVALCFQNRMACSETFVWCRLRIVGWWIWFLILFVHIDGTLKLAQTQTLLLWLPVVLLEVVHYQYYWCYCYTLIWNGLQINIYTTFQTTAGFKYMSLYPLFQRRWTQLSLIFSGFITDLTMSEYSYLNKSDVRCTLKLSEWSRFDHIVIIRTDLRVSQLYSQSMYHISNSIESMFIARFSVHLFPFEGRYIEMRKVVISKMRTIF